MPKFLYQGDVERTYPFVVDNGTGLSIVAEPGKSYDLDELPADGLWSEPAKKPAPAPTTETAN